MKSSVLSVSLFSALVLAVPSAMAADAPIAKQLSGPPSDFALMQAFDPADAAIFSKSALLPVEMLSDKSGATAWTGALPVEGNELRFIVFSGTPGDWSVKMLSPDGDLKSASALSTEHRASQFGLQNAMHEVDYYAFDNLQPGHWSLDIEALNKSASRGFILLEGDPATRLMSYQGAGRQWVGEPINLLASLYLEAEAGPVAMGKSVGDIRFASLRVTTPGGEQFEVAMNDEGISKDGGAANGIFGGSFIPEQPGLYQAQVVVHGINKIGAPLVRTAEHLIAVVEPGLQLTSDKAMGGMLEDQRFEVRIPVAVAKADQHYRAYAEVWGQYSNGKSVPVAWVGGMVTPENGAISMPLDQRWVALAEAHGPFELRNLRFEDPDFHVVVADAKQLPLNLPEPSLKLAAQDVVIDESMLMGPRPLAVDLAKNTSRRLLLVHGYCSGGVWPTGHFSNASTFLDANQSRSHDQFAQLIRNFGNNWGSFGVVAHSQGGAASLHLYTYYWSGLDNAVGNRLIQSVGTPYQGTNLAGILATLGNWFGVGCGTNNNLTYNGATAWLSGIPNWARSRVNYYTTSFDTAWWRWDYCNAATDLVLTDPEDGTTERHKGQLPGAVNRGHVTGQCHTDNMRDPAQYRNASRNSVMNSNAAR